MANILITGGAGFIGINLVKYWLHKYPDDTIIVLDKLTYAANIHDILDLIKYNKNLFLHYGDICDYNEVYKVFTEYKIDGVFHLAAESHVDNSINKPMIFTKTNVEGTHNLLEIARQVWGEGSQNRFVHVSTDEVYGSLDDGDPLFTEESMIKPSSPYSASKAASDLMALAYARTYKMNIVVTNCSNNYGPYQHEEKLIPHMTKLALQNKELTLYGTGLNIRDWIYVKDHCAALDTVYFKAAAAARYNIGAFDEKTNVDIAKFILDELDKSYGLITYIQDRKGHDYRYGIDPSKVQALGWRPRTSFGDGMHHTIQWYKEKWNGEF